MSAKPTAPPHDLWKVARVDARRLGSGDREGLIGWVAKATGLDEAEVCEWVRPVMLVSQSGEDRRYRLHLSRMVRDDQDRVVVDHAAGQLQVEPLVYEITDFPAWLPAVSHQQEIGDS